jgi:5'-3' exonuclease
MGVPRLFKVLCERYPLILRGASVAPVPEFDNLYVDFNGEWSNLSGDLVGGWLHKRKLLSACSRTGIVHTCSHDDADSLHESEEVRSR